MNQYTAKEVCCELFSHRNTQLLCKTAAGWNPFDMPDWRNFSDELTENDLMRRSIAKFLHELADALTQKAVE